MLPVAILVPMSKRVKLMIGQRLKQIRLRRNETQEQTAEVLGVNVRTYQKWERDNTSEMMSKHFNLFRFLGWGNSDAPDQDGDKGQKG